MLYKAARDADFERLELSHERGGRIDWKNWIDNDNIPIHVAALEGHTEVVLWLISRNSPINICNKYFLNTPLRYACSKGHVNAVSLLLETELLPMLPIGMTILQCIGQLVKWMLMLLNF